MVGLVSSSHCQVEGVGEGLPGDQLAVLKSDGPKDAREAQRSGRPIVGISVRSLEVGGQAFDLPAGQRWEVTAEGNVWPVAAGESESAESVQRSPHRAVLPSLAAESEFLGPFDEVEFEAFGFGIESGGDSSKKEHGARPEDRQPKPFHVVASRVEAKLREDRILERAHMERELRKRECCTGSYLWLRAVGQGRPV